MRVLKARVFVAGNQLAELLERELPGIFGWLPQGSLWLVGTDELLLRRLTFIRGQLAFTLTPDIPLETGKFEGFTLLMAHGLTRGVDFASLLSLPLLAFSPGVVGMALSWEPHALVLFFGQTMDLNKPRVDSASNLFRPQTLARPDIIGDQAFSDGLTLADVEPLLPWWLERLNIIYSHITDPTQFDDGRIGLHDAAAQTAWYLTLERLLADATILLSEPRIADITRINLAFDILDKTEGLLNYPDSGPGFKDLLRRSKTLQRLNQAWTRLPADLQDRFRRHTQLTFDQLYDDIRANTVSFRKTKNGMLIAEDNANPAKASPLNMNDYVARLIRAVRNSGHGLKRLLREPERLLVATHTGDMPPQLADVTALIVLALVADADRLCAGDWW